MQMFTMMILVYFSALIASVTALSYLHEISVSVNVANRSCQMDDNVYEHEKRWLESDCSRVWKCLNGDFKVKDFACPSGSRCKRGMCQCKNLQAAEERDDDRILTRCKETEWKWRKDRGRKSCRICGKRYKHGQKWLSNNCASIYHCDNGRVKADHYACPEKSRCKRGKCMCARGYRVDKSDGGILKSCKRRDRSCKYKNKTYKNRRVWLNTDCSKRMSCQSGEIVTESYQCPDNSECKLGGTCVCNKGARPSKRPNGLLIRCRMPPKLKCGKGFKSIHGKCLHIDKNAKLSFYEAKRKCRDMGGRLFVAKDLFGFFQKLNKGKQAKGRNCFIGGAPELSVRRWNQIKRKTTRKFIYSAMKKFKCSSSRRYKTFRRFSGGPRIGDLNYRSRMRMFCLSYDFRREKTPAFASCYKKMGYICEQVPATDRNVRWTKWFNLNRDIEKGDDESIYKVIKYLNKDPNNKVRLCRKPLAMECRDSASHLSYSSNKRNGLRLKRACKNNRIWCLTSQNEEEKSCPDFEIRFKCPVDETDSCSTREVRSACSKRGMACVNRCNGAICVKRRRPKTTKAKIDTAFCTYNSREYELQMCRASGDPHYTTADGYKYNFMGECSYNFISTSNSFVGSEDFPAFSIVVTNYKKTSGRRVSWTKSFELTIGSTTYTFTQGRFFITNGLTIEANAIGFSSKDLTITQECKGNSNRLLIETYFCLRIVWDNMHALFVYIPEVYMGKVTGLCGNFDRDSRNDIMDPITKKRLTPEEIGERYLLPGLKDGGCSKSVPVPVPCSVADIEKYKGPEFCGVFNINGSSPLVQAVAESCDSSSCTVNLNALQNELLECIEDLCWDEQTDRCHDLEDSIEEIITRLYLDDPYLDSNWRNFSSCQRTEETRCAQRRYMIYSPRYIPACQNTCYEPEKADTCDTEETSFGCICAEGYYLNSKAECVQLHMCDLSCTLYKDNGDTVQMEDGDEQVVVPCQRIAVCKRGVITERILKPCPDNAECVDYGKKCQCRKGYMKQGDECVSDKRCHHGYSSHGEKCYKHITELLDWHSAAIRCGAEGAHLARYDDEADESLESFLKDLHGLAHRREMYCGPGSLCLMPYGYIAIQIKLRHIADFHFCETNFQLAEDGKSILVQKECRAKFVVTLVKELKSDNRKSHIGVWIGGNSHVFSQSTRLDDAPFQVSPPRMVEMSSYQNPDGCFQATLNDHGDLIVYPEKDCGLKKSFICEYDNNEPLPHDTDLLDFKVIKQKATYEEAVQLCNNLNRPLAVIYTEKQQDRVHGILEHVGEHGWIGARFNDALEEFVWLDNSVIEYNNWAEGEPDNQAHATDHEHCVSMEAERGYWSSDDCNDRFYPICGLPYDIETPEYTKYFDISEMDSFDELIHRVDNDGNLNALCLRPYVIECSARSSDHGNWVTNFNQTGQTLFCSLHTFNCRENEGLDCNTFRVRFLCPAEINQCDVFEDLNISPCRDGQLCLPVPKHYVCRCPHYTRFNEHTQSCARKCGSCRAWGDPHYTTFSGMRYDFMGTCMYKFAGMCPLPEFETAPHFDVYTKNKACGRREASCIDFIEIHLRNMRVMFGSLVFKKDFVITAHRGTDRFLLNGKEQCQRHLQVKGVFTLKRGFNSLLLYVDCLDLTVKFFGAELIVDVPSAFNGQMCGLCGDCSTEQFRLKNLTLVTVPKTQRGDKFKKNEIIPVVNEWIVPYEGYETDEDLAQCKVVDPLDECTAEIRVKLEGHEFCGIYKQESNCISACFSEVDPTDYYENCIIDACHSDAEESVCNSLKAYAEECRRNGIYLNWRRNDFCKYDCKDKVYRHIASCQPTCGRETMHGNSCDEEPEEGCVCPEGLRRSGDDCVTPDKCGCNIRLSEEVDPWYIPPGESVLLPGCLGKMLCNILDDGSSETIYESFALDPNAVCREGPPPFFECVEGYVMESDNVTCRKLPKVCGLGYVNRADMCITTDDRNLIWRHAIHACNSNDGTLVLIDTVEKFSELKNIMENGSYDQIFISGQVTASVNEHGQVQFIPVLDMQQGEKIAYRNFHFKLPPGVQIVLGETITVEDLGTNEIILGLAAQRSDDGTVFIAAVPRDVPSNFICEERDVPEEDKEWYGPCNSDTVMKDGDKETKDSLLDAGCLVCPAPSEISCDKVEAAPGTAEGECRITKSGTYYHCDQGAECIDHQIRTRCAKDADECVEFLDDCPGRSTCVNTIGGYACKCDEDYPAMIRGECQGISTCTMTGPKTSQDYVFSFNGFSNEQGYFDYDCQFSIGGICPHKYNNDSGLPFIDVKFVGAITPTGMEPLVSGYIYDPTTNKERTFAVDPSLFSQRKIMIGNPERETDTGFVIEDINTLFAPIVGNVLIIFHLDGFFKVTISYPLEVKLELAEVYNDMQCGICVLTPESDSGYIILSEEQAAAYSFNPDVPCARHVPTPPSTTTATTTTSTTTTTTTQEPQDSCDLTDVCDALSNLCTTSKEDCITSICKDGVDICTYLESNTFSNCAAESMADFLRPLSCHHCGDDMHFAYNTKLTQSSCQNPDGYDYNEENTNPQNVFRCVCNEGLILSGSKCIPIEECGCVSNEGIYYEQGSSWNNADCSKTYYCSGSHISEYAYGCHPNAECREVSNELGYVCICKTGFFGSGSGPDGCVEGRITDDGSEICIKDRFGRDECVCNQGFSSNCFECTDIDECAAGFDSCDPTMQNCINEKGSFRCECNEGFKLEDQQCVPESKGRTCDDGPYDKVITLSEEEDGGITCLAENTIVRSCDNLVCNLGIQNCCMPTDFFFKEVSLSCSRADGEFSHSKIKMVAQPYSCVCDSGSEDPAA